MCFFCHGWGCPLLWALNCCTAGVADCLGCWRSPAPWTAGERAALACVAPCCAVQTLLGCALGCALQLLCGCFLCDDELPVERYLSLEDDRRANAPAGLLVGPRSGLYMRAEQRSKYTAHGPRAYIASCREAVAAVLCACPAYHGERGTPEDTPLLVCPQWYRLRLLPDDAPGNRHYCDTSCASACCCCCWCCCACGAGGESGDDGGAGGGGGTDCCYGPPPRESMVTERVRQLQAQEVAREAVLRAERGAQRQRWAERALEAERELARRSAAAAEAQERAQNALAGPAPATAAAGAH